jgi:hypothetical protein
MWLVLVGGRKKVGTSGRRRRNGERLAGVLYLRGTGIRVVLPCLLESHLEEEVVN